MKVKIIQLIVLLFMINEVCCDDEFMVKINKKYTSSIGSNIEPQEFTDINKVTNIEFIDAGNRIVPSNLSVSNFFELDELIIENQNLENAPNLKNLAIIKLSLAGNKIKAIQNTTFTNVSLNGYLYLHANQISSIDDYSFPEIDGIILNCNSLTTFKSSWFRVPAKLRTIYMRNNKIITLDKDAFKDTVNMFHLILASNQIKHLPDGLFHSSNLHTLDLGNNQLYELKSSWFTKTNLHITRLKLDFNRLSFIKEDFLKKVRIYYAFFSGNPWQCPCLNEIKKWMQESLVYNWVLDEYKDVLPVCIYANSFKNHCITHVDEELYETYISGTDVSFKSNQCSDLF